MEYTPILTYLAISPPDMFAGFCGGISYAILTKRTKAAPLFWAAVLGTLAANWCGVVAGVYIPGAAAHSGAYFVGAGGPAILRSYLKKWGVKFFEDDDLPQKGKNGLEETEYGD
jgi:hypothetical protein